LAARAQRLLLKRGSLSRGDHVEVEGAKRAIPIIVRVVGVHADYHLLAILLTVVLVVHVEECGDRHDVADEKVGALGQLAEPWILLGELEVIGHVNSYDQIEGAADEVRPAEEAQDYLQAARFSLERAAPIYVVDTSLGAKVVHDAN